MKLSRDFTKYIHFILDQLVPPILRDQKWFMVPAMRIILKDKLVHFLRFKENAHLLSDAEYSECYENTYGILNRETDLNQACIDKIVNTVSETSVLEVGCGNGYLSGILSNNKGGSITACDINITTQTKDNYPKVNFVRGSAESIPFADNYFNETVCTHTLEHVRDLSKAIDELRRVTKNKLIVVVPKQRPYRYTFDLHLSFFPYSFSVYQAFKPSKEIKTHLEIIDGDWFYVENYI